MVCSFTLKHYREILELALSRGYKFLGFHEQYCSKNHKIIYLRHDIDVCIEEAISMADLESEIGISSTYFILVNSPVYNPLSADCLGLISYIQEKGHWVGLHIDPLLINKGNVEDIEDEINYLFEFFVKKLKLVPVISFHRPVPEIIGKSFKKFISAYSPKYFKDIIYISDSRGMWQDDCPCNLLYREAYFSMQILIHPIWWKENNVKSVKEKLFYLIEERCKKNKSYLANNIKTFSNLL